MKQTRSLRATCNTARRFSHAPICLRLGHPPPSCSATPGSAGVAEAERRGWPLAGAAHSTSQG